MRYIISALMLLVVFAALGQQGKLSRAAIDSIRALHAMREGGSVLHFPKSRIDMGAMLESDTARVVSFFFENRSGRSVAVERVTSSCGCAVVKYDTATIAPQGKGRIDVRFSPKGKAGTADTDIFVYLSGGKNPIARLVLLGNVIGNDEWTHLPQSMGALKLKSCKVDFGTVTRSQRRIERIACANAGVVPLRLSALIKPEYVTLRTEPEVLQPGEEGDILVIVDAELIKTVGEQRFRVLVEGVKGTPSVRTIEGRLYISDDKE
jgi:hypothetical protein